MVLFTFKRLYNAKETQKRTLYERDDVKNPWKGSGRTKNLEKHGVRYNTQSNIHIFIQIEIVGNLLLRKPCLHSKKKSEG